MGRRKQSRPHRSGRLVIENTDLDKEKAVEAEGGGKYEFGEIDKPYFVEVDKTWWLSSEHLDISEVLLTDLNLREGISGVELIEDFDKDPNCFLRFRVSNVNEFLGRIKLGHWPSLSNNNVLLEFVRKSAENDLETPTVLLSGRFDGTDEAITGLVHLTSLRFFTLRPVLGFRYSEDMKSLRMRVEILKSAFNACGSLLDVSRQVWKKSMLNVMSWLRPETITSEIRYGIRESIDMEIDSQGEVGNDASYIKKKFDVAVFYEAIKPSKTDPIFEGDIPNLLPELRPYQRRAVYWMIQREKRLSAKQDGSGAQFHSPLCVPVDFLDECSKMFFNPFSGNVSMHPQISSPYIFGGILADEMGLGKTVELLACVFSHQKPASEVGIVVGSESQVKRNDKNNFRRLKRERVECICGAVSESLLYKGLWVQCDICDAWQHADCVGYSAKGKHVKSKHACDRKKYMTTMAMTDGDFVCQICSELIQATESPIASGATLVVCPAPILPQWHSEILCHTRQGSIKTCIYEGVRAISLSNGSLEDIGEFVSADIVLTTYDVLREDLSHDFDRHEGDRRFMRYQKRYPVIPTLLTRIFWWRVCLDEAQMVENNAAAAAEMALRLHAKHRWCVTGTPVQRKLDDLFGLLRFLKASPFDVHRWWTEVILDPYEKGDAWAIEFTHRYLKQIMWRSSKVHVADELHLPAQEECLSWLTLSPTEEHFYQRQHETCVSYAQGVIQTLRNDILNRSSAPSHFFSNHFITHAEAGKLLNALLKLRQACCHPQVGNSGLCSLQQSPMTMEEILMVLIGKTKIEGEEALRRLVVALNGLAAIGIIEKDLALAVSLYKEAFDVAAKNSEDFRLDPLLNIHIHHNLAEILSQTYDYPQELPTEGKESVSSFEIKHLKMYSVENYGEHAVKRHKLSASNDLDSSFGFGEPLDCASCISKNELNGDQDYNHDCHVSTNLSCIICLRVACEALKQKYLSAFSSKLYVAQQEFRKAYVQVTSLCDGKTEQCTDWWLEALEHAAQNKEMSNELLQKIDGAIVGSFSNSKQSRITARFRSIHALKYHVQTGLDQMEASRKVLIDRLLQIDQTMDNPKEEDIECVGNCRNCQANHNGPQCILCELDTLFQNYEARLFRLNKEHGGMVTSADEAVDLQKRNSELNRFYWNLEHLNKQKTSSDVGFEESKKRDVKEKVVVSKSPSQVEVILGVIKSYCKAHLGKEGVSAASKHLHILEGMRKEYGHARSLAIAQAQYLRAHDEIKMAISRLHLKSNEDDKLLDALDENELPAYNSEYSHDKFMSMTLLSQIKGKLRYLKGLVQSDHNSPMGSSQSSSSAQELTSMSKILEEKSGCISKDGNETCPVCHDKLSNQKMVFQCGHITCCKCLFAMTERRLLVNKSKVNWVMCPTCRQHSDFGNIAYAVDRQNESSDSATFLATERNEESEASITVKGSYGTKIEAVTRRILWIKITDANAKVLVFSSWNDVLDVLEHAFAANDISHIRMKGGRKSHIAISEFRDHQNCRKVPSKIQLQQSAKKSIQVLLLLIQHGSNGLNLLEAQHVVLVEPLLNPAVEAQAISRVHRVGQEKRTLVHRFIVKNTVEESIYKLNRSRNNSSFISGNTKNQDQPILTLKDLESLFAVPLTLPKSDENPTGSLRHLPPSVAAAIAAERRLNEQRA